MRRRRSKGDEPLSRRERQVLSFLYAKGEASAADVFGEAGNFPTYNAVRSTLRVLEAKGHVVHEKRGRQYLYRPTVARETARRSWLAHLVQSMFGGSATALVNTLIDERIATGEDLARLEKLIRNARSGGRGGAR